MTKMFSQLSLCDCNFTSIIKNRVHSNRNSIGNIQPETIFKSLMSSCLILLVIGTNFSSIFGTKHYLVKLTSVKNTVISFAIVFMEFAILRIVP